MGTLVVSENVTLDGVMQDPTGDDGFERGGWFSQMPDEDRQAWAEVECGEALRAEALLIGRHSYEFLVDRWPGRTGAWADRLNSMPKYVVSSTLGDPSGTTPPSSPATPWTRSQASSSASRARSSSTPAGSWRAP